MNSQEFKTRIDHPHKVWLGGHLGITVNGYLDIDLHDDRLAVEIKSRYDRYRSVFTIHHYQYVQYPGIHEGKELYWAFLLYGLRNQTGAISLSDIETCARNRRAWFLPWDFVKGFKVSNPKTGPYIYVNKKSFENLPFTEHKVQGGKLYLPPNAPELEKRLEMPF